KLSPGRTYRVVAESIEDRQKPGGQLVHDLLLSEAKAIAGPPVPQEGGLIDSFGDSDEEDWRLWRAALEHELAAWYYLDGRYKLTRKLSESSLGPKDQQHLQELKRVGGELLRRLGPTPPTPYDSIRSEIAEIVTIIAKAEKEHRPCLVS